MRIVYFSTGDTAQTEFLQLKSRIKTGEVFIKLFYASHILKMVNETGTQKDEKLQLRNLINRTSNKINEYPYDNFSAESKC